MNFKSYIVTCKGLFAVNTIYFIYYTITNNSKTVEGKLAKQNIVKLIVELKK